MQNLILVFEKGYLEDILSSLYTKGYNPIQVMYSINIILLEADKDAIENISILDGVISVELERSIRL